jgi:hypothetical protein
MTRRGALALAPAAAIAIGLAALIVPGRLAEAPRERAAAAAAAALVLGAPAGAAVTIGPHPIGLSIEYPLLAHDLGSGRCPSSALVHALEALGSPPIRIGGDSQDAVAPAGTPAYPGVSDLPADFWSRVACLERETRAPIIVGLNLASGEPGWAAELAASARAAIPSRLLSFELGNEPDIYGAPVRWWNGHALTSTAMPWATYLARARAVAAVLGAGSVLEGPDFASGRWVRMVPALTRTLHLRTIDAHFYPLDACRDPATATTAALLSRQIQTKIDERVRLARDARAERLPAVISETNSVSCGGVAGISDEPAAAVWAVRMIVRALRAGFSSVRFHASGSAYDPFVVNAGVLTVRPLEVGLLFAARVLGAGGVLRAIPSGGALDAVAVTRPGGARIVVLSNYTAAPRWVSVAARGPVSMVGVAAAAPVHTAAVATVAGRARVELAPNSVEAITLPPTRPAH